jgi:zinc/manganese transport system permease protein
LGGAVIGINPLIGLIGTTIVVALTMGGLGERLRGRDIAIGTVLAWVLGLGALFFNLFNAYGSRITGFSGRNLLFADILSIPESQISIIALISGLVLLALVLIGRPLLFASLDPDVAAAQGVPVRALGLGFMALLAVTVCIATMAVGALLVFALLLLPAATAYQMTTRPSVALALSAGLAIIFSWLGIVISFYTNYPTSVCISLVSFAGYVLVVGRRGRLKT